MIPFPYGNAEALYLSGLSIRAVAKQMGTSPSTALRLLRSAGVKMRSNRKLKKRKTLILVLEQSVHAKVKKAAGKAGVQAWIRGVINEHLAPCMCGMPKRPHRHS